MFAISSLLSTANGGGRVNAYLDDTALSGSDGEGDATVPTVRGGADGAKQQRDEFHAA